MDDFGISFQFLCGGSAGVPRGFRPPTAVGRWVVLGGW
jgi:hypothetical protein